MSKISARKQRLPGKLKHKNEFANVSISMSPIQKNSFSHDSKADTYSKLSKTNHTNSQL